MRLSELGDEAEAAAQLMAEAARLARHVQVTATGVHAKADASPVTIADFAVQAVVASRLAARFPADALVAEEDADALREPAARGLLSRVLQVASQAEPHWTAEGLLDAIDRGRGEPGTRFWTLDPIDGTKGLLRGGQYVVALALIVAGRVQVGAIGCPKLVLGGAAGGREGGVAVAARGCGSWWIPLDGGPPTRLRVSRVADPERARIAHSVEESHSDRGRLEAVRHALGCLAPPVLMDSQAKHVAIAGGEADVLLRFPRPGYHEAIWDVAAGALLIEEAGGLATDLAGLPLDFSTGRQLIANVGLMASNGRLHAAVRDAVARA